VGVEIVEQTYTDLQKIASNFTVINWVHGIKGTNIPSVEMKNSNYLKILYGYVPSADEASVFWHQKCRKNT
jgi:hypothetical protein